MLVTLRINIQIQISSYFENRILHEINTKNNLLKINFIFLFILFP